MLADWVTMMPFGLLVVAVHELPVEPEQLTVTALAVTLRLGSALLPPDPAL